MIRPRIVLASGWKCSVSIAGTQSIKQLSDCSRLASRAIYSHQIAHLRLFRIKQTGADKTGKVSVEL